MSKITKIKKQLALIAHSNSGKASEIRTNLKRLGIEVPNDLRSHEALSQLLVIASSKKPITRDTDNLYSRSTATKI